MKYNGCYRYRLRPTKDQEQMFLMYADSRCCIYNWGLRTKREHYLRTGQTLSHNDLKKMLTVYKRQEGNEWLRDCSIRVLQSALEDLEKAFQAFFSRVKARKKGSKVKAGYPRFKSRKNTLPSFRFPAEVKVFENGVYIPKVGVVRCRLDNRMPLGPARTTTIRQDVDGKWYVTFTTEFEVPDVEPTCNNPVGIDMGLASFVTLSTGEKIECGKFYRRGQRKIARLSRKLSRCVRGSNGYAKAKLKLAKTHKKIRNRRDDFQHAVSARLVKEHDVICVETLNVQTMKQKKRHLGKSLSDAAISAFLFKLNYKSLWANRRAVFVDRFFRSTRRCSCCGTDVELALSDRVWTCETCSTIHDRDVNASQNILIEGLRIIGAGKALA